MSHLPKHWYALLLLTFTPFGLIALEKGTPPVRTFTPDEYNAGAQNTAAAQSDDGLMYFANSDGVLVYDGEYWSLLDTGESGLTRDVKPTRDGRIWVAGSHDFGWIDIDSNTFTSLKEKVTSEENPLGETWHLFEDKDKIIIVSAQRLINWQNEAISYEFMKSEGRLVPMQLGDRLLIHQRGEGLKDVTNPEHKLLFTDTEVANGGINFIENIDDERMIIGTFDKGFFYYDGRKVEPVDTEFSKSFSNFLGSNSTLIDNQSIAAGTYNHGVFLLDFNGEFIDRFGEETGLLGDSAWNVFVDRFGDLWIPQNRGISLVQLSAPYTLFDKRHGLNAEVIFDLERRDGKLYAGTYNGIYMLEPGTPKGTSPYWYSVGNNNQIVWNLTSDSAGMFASLERNIEKIQSKDSEIVFESNRACTFLEKIPGKTDLYLSGIYSDLAILSWDGAKFSIFKEWPLFGGITSVAYLDDNLVWFGTVQKGLLSGNISRMINSEEESKFDSILNPENNEAFSWSYVVPMAAGILIISDAGIFHTQGSNTKLTTVKNSPLSLGVNAFGVNFDNGNFDDQVWITYPIEQNGKRIYRMAKITWPSGNHPPEFKILNAEGIDELGDIHSLLIEDEGELAWIGGSGGIVRHELTERPEPEPVATLMTQTTFYQDEEQMDVNSPQPVFNFPVDRAHFEFATPIFTEDKKLYQTRMMGLENHWSEPSPTPFREFTNLAEGHYTFEARSIDPSGENPSIPASFSFVVLPPWYRTIAAYIVYVVLLLFIGWLYMRWRTIALRKKNLALEAAVEERTIELVQTNVQLAKANSAKNDFLASVSHEIRNPMNGVVGLTALLKDSLNDSKEYGEKIKQLDSTSGHLKSLLDDLLDFSALEENKVSLKPSPFYLGDELDTIEEIYRPVAEKKSLTLEVIKLGETNLTLLGDAGKVRQILANLIGNAIKFTEKGGVKLEVCVEVNESQADLHCLVIDTGPGIPQELQKTVFGKFQRGVFDQKGGPSGMGLGLSISSRLATMMDAKIGLSSSDSSGTTFHFDVTLPIVQGDLANASGLTEATIAALHGKHVLLVEDQEYNRIVAEELLARLGLTVVSAESGEIGLKKFEEEHFDVVLLDNNLPGISGIEVAEVIRSGEKRETPIIAISAHVTKRDRDNYDRIGINATVAKPFTNSELKRTLARILIDDAMLDASTSDEPKMSGLFGMLRFIANGDEAKLKSMVAGVLKELQEQLDNCRKYMNSGDWEQADKYTHSALSSARLIGDEDLQREAKALHEAALNKDEGEVQKRLEVIKPMLDKILQYPVEF
ncbi:hybrid sensor histidine kinase/response regulator [Rubellicoccus peritrichatus]|uniref:histidine kinase n=1 Tax=Rubellicoccus peritrichatus TaxID=3080537 RepID=A0AAQ3QTM1_9BACT|nr:ATP-binding protein [Puniceicoccus sp. CR14]WOO39528.1 ATP-binding protein [Puniceicoccus sp. CR14]